MLLRIIVGYKKIAVAWRHELSSGEQKIDFLLTWLVFLLIKTCELDCFTQ